LPLPLGSTVTTPPFAQLCRNGPVATATVWRPFGVKLVSALPIRPHRAYNVTEWVNAPKSVDNRRLHCNRQPLSQSIATVANTRQLEGLVVIQQLCVPQRLNQVPGFPVLSAYFVETKSGQKGTFQARFDDAAMAGQIIASTYKRCSCHADIESSPCAFCSFES
jgi:hypothetical protein